MCRSFTVGVTKCRGSTLFTCLLMETSLQLINPNPCTIAHDNFYRKLQPSSHAILLSSGSRGRVQGVQPPPTIGPCTNNLFETEILTLSGSYITFKLVDLLMKCAFHFATKLNSRDTQKCNCFWVLLWSVCLCSQSSISCANGGRHSQIEKHVFVSAFSAGRQLCILYE